MSFISEWFGLINKVPITVPSPFWDRIYLILKTRQGRPNVAIVHLLDDIGSTILAVGLLLYCNSLLFSVGTERSHQTQLQLTTHVQSSDLALNPRPCNDARPLP